MPTLKEFTTDLPIGTPIDFQTVTSELPKELLPENIQRNYSPTGDLIEKVITKAPEKIYKMGTNLPSEVYNMAIGLKNFAKTIPDASVNQITNIWDFYVPSLYYNTAKTFGQDVEKQQQYLYEYGQEHPDFMDIPEAVINHLYDDYGLSKAVNGDFEGAMEQLDTYTSENPLTTLSDAALLLGIVIPRTLAVVGKTPAITKYLGEYSKLLTIPETTISPKASSFLNKTDPLNLTVNASKMVFGKTKDMINKLALNENIANSMLVRKKYFTINPLDIGASGIEKIKNWLGETNVSKYYDLSRNLADKMSMMKRSERFPQLQSLLRIYDSYTGTLANTLEGDVIREISPLFKGLDEIEVGNLTKKIQDVVNNTDSFGNIGKAQKELWASSDNNKTKMILGTGDSTSLSKELSVTDKMKELDDIIKKSDIVDKKFYDGMDINKLIKNLENSDISEVKNIVSKLKEIKDLSDKFTNKIDESSKTIKSIVDDKEVIINTEDVYKSLPKEIQNFIDILTNKPGVFRDLEKSSIYRRILKPGETTDLLNRKNMVDYIQNLNKEMKETYKMKIITDKPDINTTINNAVIDSDFVHDTNKSLPTLSLNTDSTRLEKFSTVKDIDEMKQYDRDIETAIKSPKDLISALTKDNIRSINYWDKKKFFEELLKKDMEDFKGQKIITKNIDENDLSTESNTERGVYTLKDGTTYIKTKLNNQEVFIREDIHDNYIKPIERSKSSEDLAVLMTTQAFNNYKIGLLFGIRGFIKNLTEAASATLEEALMNPEHGLNMLKSLKDIGFTWDEVKNVFSRESKVKDINNIFKDIKDITFESLTERINYSDKLADKLDKKWSKEFGDVPGLKTLSKTIGFDKEKIVSTIFKSASDKAFEIYALPDIIFNNLSKVTNINKMLTDIIKDPNSDLYKTLGKPKNIDDAVKNLHEKINTTFGKANMDLLNKLYESTRKNEIWHMDYGNPTALMEMMKNSKPPKSIIEAIAKGSSWIFAAYPAMAMNSSLNKLFMVFLGKDLAGNKISNAKRLWMATVGSGIGFMGYELYNSGISDTEQMQTIGNGAVIAKAIESEEKRSDKEDDDFSNANVISNALILSAKSFALNMNGFQRIMDNVETDRVKSNLPVSLINNIIAPMTNLYPRLFKEIYAGYSGEETPFTDIFGDLTGFESLQSNRRRRQIDSSYYTSQYFDIETDEERKERIKVEKYLQKIRRDVE